MRAALLAIAAAAACTQDPIAVAVRGGADHNRAALLAAARQCRTAGNSPEAFAAFAKSVLTLRVGMDETVADEAELLLLALALDAAAPLPGAATGADAPILTVWPIGLAPRITAPVPGYPLSDAWSEYMPGPDEDAGRYAMRLCGAQLASTCGYIVPEGQTAVVASVAIERFTDRVRAAVANCLSCGGDVWRERIAGWEGLDRAAVAYIEPARRRAAVARWPVAGPGAREAPEAPTLTLEDDGGILVDDESVGPTALVAFLAATRREARTSTLRVHLAPSAAVARLRGALDQAAAAGFVRVALVARVPRYPWQLVAYTLDVGASLPVKDADPIQILARVLDVRATR
ncbi:MAG: hypothetical protein IPL61_12725 [Myxococcales bacterium]|nr:hypothetical protein [Myxococcales bacterium]